MATTSTVPQELTAHRWAELFPLLEGEEFDRLVADLKADGLLEPIVIYEGKILDGRNRFRACLKAGEEPKYEEFQSRGHADAARRYVVAKNVIRRHLSESQLAMLALRVMPDLEREARQRQRRGTSAPAGAKGKASELAAMLFGVSARTVERAQRIQREAPDRAAEVHAGNVTLTEVENDIRERHKVENHRPDAYDREVTEFLALDKHYNKRLDEISRPAGLLKFSPEAGRFTIRRLDRTAAGIEALKGKLTTQVAAENQAAVPAQS